MVDTGAFRLTVPEDKAAMVRKHGAKEYVFGIRPEDIRKRRDKKENYSEEHLNALVNVIEPGAMAISVKVVPHRIAHEPGADRPIVEAERAYN